MTCDPSGLRAAATSAYCHLRHVTEARAKAADRRDLQEFKSLVMLREMREREPRLPAWNPGPLVRSLSRLGFR